MLALSHWIRWWLLPESRPSSELAAFAKLTDANPSRTYRPSRAIWESLARLTQVVLFTAAVFHEEQVSRNSSSYGQKSGRELLLACRALWSKKAASAVPAVLLEQHCNFRDCWLLQRQLPMGGLQEPGRETTATYNLARRTVRHKSSGLDNWIWRAST